MVLEHPKLETFGPNLTKYAKHDMQPKEQTIYKFL